MKITAETTEREILEKLEELFKKAGICADVALEEDEDGDCYFNDAGFFVIDGVITHWKKNDIEKILYRDNTKEEEEGERSYVKFYFRDGSWLIIDDGENYSYGVYLEDGSYYKNYGVCFDEFETVEYYIRERRGCSLLEDQFLVNDKNVLVSCLKATKKIIVPTHIKKIASSAFIYSDFESIILPDGLREIGDNAFFACKNVSEIYVPDTCIDLGYQVFAQCKNLKRIHLSPKCNRLLARTFLGCTALEEISGIDFNNAIIGNDALEGTPLEKKFIQSAE